MKKSLIILPLIACTMLVGCNKNKGGKDEPISVSEITSDDTSIVIGDNQVRVNFYLDYNQIDADNIYYSYVVDNGSLLKEPKKPDTPPFPEFPVFKGWSKKEIIDDYKDLWNFSKDRVETEAKIYRMYGIWVAEGE